MILRVISFTNTSFQSRAAQSHIFLTISALHPSDLLPANIFLTLFHSFFYLLVSLFDFIIMLRTLLILAQFFIFFSLFFIQFHFLLFFLSTFIEVHVINLARRLQLVLHSSFFLNIIYLLLKELFPKKNHWKLKIRK